MIINEYDSPFQVGVPVYPKNFIGREETLDKILPQLSHLYPNNQKHFFITGSRGMGKTSLTKYISDVLESEYGILPIHVENNGVNTVDELLKNIITELLKKAKKESISPRFKELIKDNVTKVGAWGSEIQINNNSHLVDDIKTHFIYTLQELFNDIENRKALVIIIDDINGLSDNEIFPNWYKSMVDTIAVNDDITIPISFILTGYSKKFGKLHLLNPSFSRIFQREDLELLSDEEVSDFYIKNFAKTGIKIEKNALDMMVKYTHGLPLVMQEIGFSLFNKSKTINNITKPIAIKGIIDAGESIGRSYVLSNYEAFDKSKEYKSILSKISNYNSFKFTIKELKHTLAVKEEEVLDDFLEFNLSLEFFVKYDDEYAITNELFKMYFETLNLKKWNE